MDDIETRLLKAIVSITKANLKANKEPFWPSTVDLSEALDWPRRAVTIYGRALEKKGLIRMHSMISSYHLFELK